MLRRLRADGRLTNADERIVQYLSLLADCFFIKSDFGQEVP
jgi:hypothetical protein